MVWEVRARSLLSAPLALLTFAGVPIVALAGVPPNPTLNPHSPPAATPSTQTIVNTDNGQINAGAHGALMPIPPQTLHQGSGYTGATGTHAVANGTAPPPPPQCTPGSAPAPPPPRALNATKRTFTIFPSFTRNRAGGYDGSDAAYGYNQPNAIPPGGDPTQTQLSAPATAANVAGHLIGVPVVIGAVAPDGSCYTGAASFGTPFLAGVNPPAPPSPAVVATPPFPVGPALLAQLMGRWRLGTIATLPGPGNTVSTFVHIPTCTWLDSTVPQAPVSLNAIKTAQSDGYTFFLVYNLTVTPGTINWDWGDGTASTALAADETPPPTLPTYDPSAQTWSNPCTESHPYAAVSTGRTITATQAFTVDITVTWSDGVNTTTQRVECDPSTGGDCALTVGPAQGWVSGPHPVDQIEPVPFYPASGG